MDITSTISETCQERLLNIEQKKGQEWLLKYRINGQEWLLN